MSTTQDETLKGLLETAKAKRLSPEEEEQALQLLKALIASGKKGLATSLEALVGLPWSLGVKAVVEAWPELKPTTQRQFVTAVGKLDSDQGKRMRLSVARGLFALDQKVALKLILGFCAEMDEAGPKERQLFNNVLIGKTKPWILNIPLADLKNAEANSLLKSVLPCAQQSPAFTQVWVYGWINEAGFLAKLSEEQVGSIASAVKRWQPRWQRELKKTVPALPAPIEAALAAAPQPAPQQPKAESQAQAQGQEKKKPVHPPLPKYPGRVFPKKGSQPAQPAQESGQEPADKPESESLPPQEGEPLAEPEKIAAEGELQAPESPKEGKAPREPKEGREAREGREGREAGEQRPQHKGGPAPQQQPQRPPQEQGRGQQQQQQPRHGAHGNHGGGFDLQRSLSEIHSYVGGLKAEIQQLKGQLRQKEPRRNEPREREQPTSEELETLRRHNLQLEETIHQLRHDIEELVSDHEDRASTLAMSDDLLRFKTLLGVKLGKDYFDFEALRRESATEVVRRHLGHILDHIFGVLKAEGVDFKDEE